MGRALFSQKYLSEPAVCEERLPAALDLPCQRWSPCNQFDPDSEEFFSDAQPEQFLDRVAAGSGWSLERGTADDAPHAAVLDNVSDSGSSPTTTSSNDNDEGLSDSNDSPMALGTDDPASLLPRRQRHSTRGAHHNSRRPSSPRHSETSPTFHRTSPASDFIISAPHRASSALTVVPTTQTHTVAQQAAGTPWSPVVRRTVNITPINIPSQPSLPTPASPSPPATSANYYGTTTNLIAPFRLRNAIPRFYTWNRDFP